MLREDAQASLNPLIMHLQELKSTPAIIPGLPVVMVKLPKRVIVELSQRSDVGRIFLAERPAGPALDAAVPADRIPSLWRQQVDGLPLDGEGGTRIGIVEGGTADIYSQAGLCASSPCFRHPGGVSGGFGDDWNYQHATLVASAAASDYAPRRGAAPGATVYSAGMVDGSDWALIDALHRALSANSGWYNVDVANVSWQSYCQQGMAYPDFAFDYWAREYRRTITVAAGNYDLCNDYNLRSPGKAWNVITVGAYGDQNNSDWSDDSMWSDSTYINPFGDREKPEVAAPGADVEGISRNSILAVRSGTSLAAPQVAGLADLLIQRSSRLLRDFPMAVKAIIMAAAMHNIEGDSRLSDRDGAGGIDAALAEKAAGDSHPTDAIVCTGPCWWNVEFNDQALPNGSRVAQRYFSASRGERMRVAVAWMSFAYCPNESYCPVDNPVNLDLEAFKPTDPTTPIATSASVNNNYEIVEFIAPDNGQYEIRVNKTTGGTGENINWLGIAWVKDATYLVDLRNDGVNGWASEIYLRNEGAEPLNATIHYFDVGGGATPKVSDNCYLFPNQQCWIPVSESNRIPAGTRGTATIGGGEEVDVAVVHHKSNGLDADDGMLAGGAGDPAFAQVAKFMFAPAVYSNIYNCNSFIQVRATLIGSPVLFVFYGRAGYADGVWPASVPSNGRIDVSPSLVFGATPWVGAVEINAIQMPMPLAASVLDVYTDGRTRTANAAGDGAATLYAAALYRAAYNTTSGIVVQNIGLMPTGVEVRFYDRSGAWRTTYLLNNGNALDGQRAAGVNLAAVPGLYDGWLGSARIVSANGQPLAAIATGSQPDAGVFAYNAASAATRTVVLPRGAKNAADRTTSYLIQNINPGGWLHVIARYYDAGGNVSGTPATYDLAPYASVGRNQGADTQLSDGWTGSIVLEADGPWMVAISREKSATSISAASGMTR